MQGRKLAPFGALAAALVIATPALASPPDWAPAWGHRAHFHRPRVVAVVAVPHLPPPVVVYRAPVYYARPPAYRVHYGYRASGALAGALAGAVIGGSVAQPEDRVAGIAIGSVLGAVIGHEISRGY